MNIYEKLQEMRCELQGSNLKKSGKNKFAGYDYFELQDIIPTINNLMKEHKVVSEINYDKEIAVLKIINSEKPDEILTFGCPVEMATLKGCHATQNLGATITYLRRYLYVNAFEIVECDVLDAGDNTDNAKNHSLNGTSKSEVKKVTGSQKANIYNYFNVLGIDNIANLPDDKDYIPVVEFLKGKGISSVEDLDFATADRLEKFLDNKVERGLKNES